MRISSIQISTDTNNTHTQSEIESLRRKREQDGLCVRECVRTLSSVVLKLPVEACVEHTRLVKCNQPFRTKHRNVLHTQQILFHSHASPGVASLAIIVSTSKGVSFDMSASSSSSSGDGGHNAHVQHQSINPKRI